MEITSKSYLSVSWRPSDLEQRKGRVVRFGNQNDLVHMYRYVTEGTFDAYMYQLIENKQRMISQILTGKNPLRSAADVDDMTLNYAEIKGLASGNPMIMEKVGLEIDIQRMEMVRNRFLNQQFNLQLNVKQKWPRNLEEESHRVVGLKKDLDKYLENPIAEDKRPNILVNGKAFDTDDHAGKAILAEISKLKKGENKVIGNMHGFDIVISKDDKPNIFNSFNTELTLRGSRSYTVSYTTSGYGTVNRMATVLKELDKRYKECEEKISNYKQWIADGEKELDKPFPKEQELKKKKDRLAEINEVLTLDKVKPENDYDVSSEMDSKGTHGNLEEMIVSANNRSNSGNTSRQNDNQYREYR